MPEGSDGDTLYFYAFNTPRKLSGGRTWEDEKEQYVKLMMDNFAQYAPELGDAVLDVHITTPDDFESQYHITRGNYELEDGMAVQLPGEGPQDDAGGAKDDDGKDADEKK